MRADMIAYARGSSCAFILLEGISYTRHVHYTDGICAPVQPIRLFFMHEVVATQRKNKLLMVDFGLSKKISVSSFAGGKAVN